MFGRLSFSKIKRKLEKASETVEIQKEALTQMSLRKVMRIWPIFVIPLGILYFFGRINLSITNFNLFLILIWILSLLFTGAIAILVRSKASIFYDLIDMKDFQPMRGE